VARFCVLINNGFVSFVCSNLMPQSNMEQSTAIAAGGEPCVGTAVVVVVVVVLAVLVGVVVVVVVDVDVVEVVGVDVDVDVEVEVDVDVDVDVDFFDLSTIHLFPCGL